MNKYLKTTEPLAEPWNDIWPTDGLESVLHCPICKHAERDAFQVDLVDNTFRVAAGYWSLWKCAGCGSAYLDPRPTPEAINLAYTKYYTHKEAPGKTAYMALSPLRKLGRRLINGYTNWRYSTRAMPSSVWGVLVAFVLPYLKTVIDREYRGMSRPPEGVGAVLDVGFGDGSFLRLARSCGWNAVGLDPDVKVVASAAKQGLTVFEGGIEHFDGQAELFDLITLSHVIEHVHDPVKVLQSCHTLLRPGGQLWLETPNIASYGYLRFQKNWRGLETPRHLVLFNRASINQAFIKAGFCLPLDRGQFSPRLWIFKASFAMEHGYSPLQEMGIYKELRWQFAKARFAGLLMPSRREYLTVIARKSAR